ncbi:PIN domain-containing protein [Hyperthermus butylicus]|uniref:VapC9 PIN-like domain-containing protein n=1 Tax=Hyperthermus butylicus (strain DSM 5456 / JCM 9403 / PLM1-5) TaxID=415426 RepID=A2BJZ5_HYPBU|nr:PIN domain-containing protein [Hyperthermus butylicus]ABM80306.1 hypothetical protein Hbut_0440 [Hyperthermus butylicus DSM 5456]
MGCSTRLRRVIFDTSMLMLLYDGVDVFGQVEELLDAKPECIVPRPVVDELQRLASSGQSLRQRRAARLALHAIELRGCKIVETTDVSADDAILELALSDPVAIVATADGELRRRLREKGLPNIYYRRSRHGLMLEG